MNKSKGHDWRKRTHEQAVKLTSTGDTQAANRMFREVIRDARLEAREGQHGH